MALSSLRRPENAEGDFYVDSTCIDCDLCRQIAPEVFGRDGEQSVVRRQPRTDGEVFETLKALVTCPTASIGTVGKQSARKASEAYPDRVDEDVYFCGYAAESSFGASSYLIRREEGNVLVDSPRHARPLARRIAEMGGIRTIFLTHRDDVADHSAWSREFAADRVMHRDECSSVASSIEHVVSGYGPIALDDDLLAIPTPGHTPGHMALLYRDRYLFSGDHLWWSETRGSLHASRGVCWHSWDEQVRSLERLLEFDFEWVLPGHGRRVHLPTPEMRRQLRRCLDRAGAASGG